MSEQIKLVTEDLIGTVDKGNAFKPIQAFPLDARTYFTDIEEAKKAAMSAAYAGSDQASETIFYFGQTLTVVNPTSHTAEFYIIDELAENCLRKVGSDASVISLDQGTTDLSIIQEVLDNQSENKIETSTATGAIILGHSNTIDSACTMGQNVLMAGEGNIATASAKSALVIGKGNTIGHKYVGAFGRSNSTLGDYSFVAGQGNQITSAGSEAAAFGHHNTIDSATGIALGQANTIAGSRGVGIGNGNTVVYEDSIAIGSFLKTGNSNQVVAGIGNVGKDNTRFEVGNGNSESSSNAFEVLNDGRAKVYGAPINYEDVVRLGDIKNNTITPNTINVTNLNATKSALNDATITNATIGRLVVHDKANDKLACSATGNASAALGEGTIANRYGVTAVGTFNKSIGDTDPAVRFVVGNGTGPADSDRSNALTVLASGKSIAGASTTSTDSAKTLATKDYVDSVAASGTVEIGEIDMSKVLLPENDLVFTVPFGKYGTEEDAETKYELTNTGKYTIATKNSAGNRLTLKDLFDQAFASDTYPTVVQPTARLYATANNSDIWSYEVGTSVTVRYYIETNVGKYEFGPATGVTFSAYNIKFNGQTKTTKGSSTAKVAFDPVTVDDSTSLSIVGDCRSSDATSAPQTALGAEYRQGEIVSKDHDFTSPTLTGFRNIFAGGMSKTDALESSKIRALVKKVKYPASTFTVDIAEGSTRAVIAVPVANDSYSVGLTYTSADQTEDYAVLLGRGLCTDSVIIVPSMTEDGRPVTAVDASAFDKDLTITGIVLPNTVTRIGMSAFYGCNNLLFAFIPSSVTEVNSSAFSDAGSNAPTGDCKIYTDSNTLDSLPSSNDFDNFIINTTVEQALAAEGIDFGGPIDCISKILDENDSNSNVVESFTRTVVTVAGASVGYDKKYTVYYLDAASPLAANTYTVHLK